MCIISKVSVDIPGRTFFGRRKLYEKLIGVVLLQQVSYPETDQWDKKQVLVNGLATMAGNIQKELTV